MLYFNHTMTRQMKQLVFLIFFSTLLVYMLTSPGDTVYNYFIRLADAFLKRRVYLAEAPPWLNELIPIDEKYFVVYPPMPAIVLLPFVALFRSNFSQTLFSILIGSFNAVLAYLVLGKLKLGKEVQIWATILFTFGTNHWFLASVGSVWYLAHVLAVFFLLLAIHEVLTKKRTVLIGMFLGAAYLSRLPTILSFPFFVILLFSKRKKLPLQLIKLGLGILPFVVFGLFYNYLRFGNIFEFGYSLVPGVLDDPRFKYGLVNLRYVPRHLKVFFLKLPIFSREFPFVKPSWMGMAIWLTTPVFLFSLLAKIKEKIVQALWLTIFLISIPAFIHCGEGYTQFGYRFAMDFIPFLLLLTTMGIGRKVQWYHKTLIIISIIVNLWGVLWINKFGWVGW